MMLWGQVDIMIYMLTLDFGHPFDEHAAFYIFCLTLFD